MLTLDLDKLSVRAGETVLDLGCGGGRHSFAALKRGANVVAADLNLGALRDVTEMAGALIAEGEVPPGTWFAAVRADALALPFPDGAFHHVIASEVLEHIPRDETAIGEIARILAPRGRAAVTVPRWWPERVCWALSERYRSSAGGHVRIYRARELEDKLSDKGLSPVSSHHAHSLHSPYWWLKCAVGVERTDARLPRIYHRFLVWQITTRPRPVDALERILNPVLGKSLVVYATKNGGTAVVR
ncbi:MAG: class I SAM-dependent methyltransferase [Actinomycetota bacterium]|nr:class I SAM-dependent methyltransferase [Actinomycetota bacterium]